MTWSEQLIVRILLLIARMVADDAELATELKHLANHISAEARRAQSTEPA